MMRLTLFLLLIAAVAATGCTSGNETSNEQTETRTSEGEVIEATGTVQYIDLEGGFYGIVADDGSRYDPTELPDEFREDGLRVSFRAEPRGDVLTTRMWGQVVRLVEISRL